MPQMVCRASSWLSLQPSFSFTQNGSQQLDNPKLRTELPLSGHKQQASPMTGCHFMLCNSSTFRKASVERSISSDGWRWRTPRIVLRSRWQQQQQQQLLIVGACGHTIESQRRVVIGTVGNRADWYLQQTATRSIVASWGECQQTEAGRRRGIGFINPWQTQRSGRVVCHAINSEQQQALDLEMELFNFMQDNGHPDRFPSKSELLLAGRRDLVEACLREGGWMTVGWDDEEENDDDVVPAVGWSGENEISAIVVPAPPSRNQEPDVESAGWGHQEERRTTTDRGGDYGRTVLDRVGNDVWPKAWESSSSSSSSSSGSSSSNNSGSSSSSGSSNNNSSGDIIEGGRHGEGRVSRVDQDIINAANAEIEAWKQTTGQERSRKETRGILVPAFEESNILEDLQTVRHLRENLEEMQREEAIEEMRKDESKEEMVGGALERPAAPPSSSRPSALPSLAGPDPVINDLLNSRPLSSYPSSHLPLSSTLPSPSSPSPSSSAPFTASSSAPPAVSPPSASSPPHHAIQDTLGQIEASLAYVKSVLNSSVRRVSNLQSRRSDSTSLLADLGVPALEMSRGKSDAAGIKSSSELSEKEPAIKNRPHGYWTNPLNLYRELVEFAATAGQPDVMPSIRQLQQANRKDLQRAIRKHGKWSEVAKKFGLRLAASSEAALPSVPAASTLGKHPSIHRPSMLRPPPAAAAEAAAAEAREGREGLFPEGQWLVARQSLEAVDFSQGRWERREAQAEGGVKEAGGGEEVAAGEDAKASRKRRRRKKKRRPEASTSGESLAGERNALQVTRDTSLSNSAPEWRVENQFADGSRDFLTSLGVDTSSSSSDAEDFSALPRRFGDVSRGSGRSTAAVSRQSSGNGSNSSDGKKTEHTSSIMERIQKLEASLSVTRSALKEGRASLLNTEENLKGAAITAKQMKEARERTMKELVRVTDSLEFRENEMMRTRAELRSARAEVSALEGRLATEFKETRKALIDRNKKLEEVKLLQSSVRSTRIVWPNAGDEVLLTGSFDGWTNKVKMEKSNAGVFVATLQLYPGQYQFKFIVDGMWKVDPQRPIIYTDGGNENNLLIVA